MVSWYLFINDRLLPVQLIVVLGAVGNLLLLPLVGFPTHQFNQ